MARWASLLVLLALAAPAWGQGSVQVWSGKKGSSPSPGPITATDVNADTRALDVAVKGTATTDPSDRDARVLGRLKIHDGSEVAQVTATSGGSLQVECTAGCGAPPSFTDDSAFSPGSTTITNVGGTYRTIRDSLDDNDAGAIALNQRRGVYVTLEDSGSNEIASATTSPGGGERGLIVRNIPSGTQAVSGTVSATQSGTWTVQPGNTANTTPWLVIPGGGSFAGTNQQAVTATATALASQAAKRVCVQALVSNAIDVYIGASAGVTTSNGYPLTPGSSWCGTVSNVNQVFVVASTTGSAIAWAAEN